MFELFLPALLGLALAGFLIDWPLRGDQDTDEDTRPGDTALRGTDDADTLTGTSGADLILGAGGDDSLAGGAADDTISGGTGNDTITGDAGMDSLLGDDGDDSITGGDVSSLFGGEGDDTLTGGSGSFVDGGDGHDLIDIQGGSEALGGDGNDTMTGGSGNSTLSGGAGDDDITGGIAYTVTSGTGSDSISLDLGDVYYSPDTFNAGPMIVTDYVAGQDEYTITYTESGYDPNNPDPDAEPVPPLPRDIVLEQIASGVAIRVEGDMTNYLVLSGATLANVDPADFALTRR